MYSTIRCLTTLLGPVTNDKLGIVETTEKKKYAPQTKQLSYQCTTAALLGGLDPMLKYTMAFLQSSRVIKKPRVYQENMTRTRAMPHTNRCK